MIDKHKKQDGVTFYCFSPLAMIFTFCLEVALAVYVLVRYRISPVVRLVAAMLIFLAGFQLAEYMVCKGSPGHALAWSRVGYVSITMLPPLGLHLTLVLAKAKRWLSWSMLLAAYGMAAAFMLFFWLASDALTGHQCLGNYVIFQVASNKGWLYGAYYYGWIFVSLMAGLYYMFHAVDLRMRRAMAALIFSYISFLLPTATVNLLEPRTLDAIPSVMCGFAVILALMLVLVVLPSVFKRKTRD